MDKRFDADGFGVIDRKTGLMWCRNAGVAEFPLTWKEGFVFAGQMNQEKYGGYGDWRLPNRRELFSLVSHEVINPSLPRSHPFENVFPGYYWSASTCARLPVQAWYVHFGGARVYRGMKHAFNMVWPVRLAQNGQTDVYFTGQRICRDEKGREAECRASPLQEAALAAGIPWPEPRFLREGKTVFDRLTGLFWTRQAGVGRRFLSWGEGLAEIARMNNEKIHGFDDWRMPSIREMESLADLGRHSPALPENHPFTGVSDFYWSETTSAYENRYAWAFYAKDGSVGVGFKENPGFTLWPVRGTARGSDGQQKILLNPERE